MNRSTVEAGGFTVVFQPSGLSGTAQPGQDLLTIARALGVEIESACGGKGVCGKCRVRLQPVGMDADDAERPVTDGEATDLVAAEIEEASSIGASAGPAAGVVSSPTPVEMRKLGPEELTSGLRLACQTRVYGPVRVFVPEESRRVIQVLRG